MAIIPGFIHCISWWDSCSGHLKSGGVLLQCHYSQVHSLHLMARLFPRYLESVECPFIAIIPGFTHCISWWDSCSGHLKSGGVLLQCHYSPVNSLHLMARLFPKYLESVEFLFIAITPGSFWSGMIVLARVPFML